MRILIASRRRGSSGIRVYTDTLAAGLVARAHGVVLLDETDGEPAPAPGVELVPLPPAAARRFGPSRYRALAGWAQRPSVARLAREHGVDVVHATHLDLAPRGLPLVVTAWDPLVSPVARARAAGERGERPRREAAYAVADAVACRRAAAVVAVTSGVARALRPLRRCVEVIPPFLPDALVRPAGARSRDVVMVAQRLDADRKGLPLALEAIGALHSSDPDVRLVLVGGWSDPGARARLPNFCDAVGPLTRSALAERLHTAGCCLVASRWEEFGYAALEALAAGAPVACTPGVGIADVGGGVFAAERRDARSLAAAVRSALRVRVFEFPPACRASQALLRLEGLYRAASST